MATLQLSERVIDAAVTKLTAGVNARIDTINAEFDASGTTLTATTGTWTESPTFTYQWQRDNQGDGNYSNIAGATASTYTLTDDDRSCRVRCQVTAANYAGSATATSNAITVDPIDVAYPTVAKYGVSPMPPGAWLVVTDGGGGQTAQFTGEGPHSFALDLELLVLVKDDDSDRTRLGKRLLRLERAVIETLWDDAPQEQLTVTVGGATNYPYINPARVVPGPVFNAQDDESLLSSFRIVVFTVTKREN